MDGKADLELCLVIAVMLVLCVSLWTYFKRAGWL